MKYRAVMFSFAAGLISAGLFLLVTALGLGFFFLFLPTLPLLCLALEKDERIAAIGSVIAMVAIGSAGGAELGIIYILLLGLPSWFIAKQALLSRTKSNGMTEWYPVGRILLSLCVFGCAAVAFMTLYYAGNEGGITQVIADHLREEFKDMEDKHGDVIEQLAEQWSFLVFAMTIWCWCLSLYIHTWMATRLLVYKHKGARHSVALEVFSMPNWVLGLLAIAAIASLIGSESMRFLGKSTLVTLMLPYFLLGIALMHQTSLSWPSRRFFLIFVYVMVAVQLWPVFILAAVGFFHHIKRLSGTPTSSKS